jgi:hypothetical protein
MALGLGRKVPMALELTLAQNLDKKATRSLIPGLWKTKDSGFPGCEIQIYGFESALLTCIW